MDLLSNPKFAVAAFIFGFGFLIFVHEMGHFLVAKAVGIRATQFAIGFGQALLSYRKGMGIKVGGTEKAYWAQAAKALADEGVSLEGLSDHAKTQKINEKADALGLGETEYRLNWLPLGGYVKMLGQEDLDPTAQSDDPRSFNRRPVWARMLVISAGVVMNLIFALLFFIACFSMGVDFAAPVVGETTPLKPAAITYADGHDGDPAYRGLRPGDRITQVNGTPIVDFTEVKIASALGKAGEPVNLTVEREGEANPLIYNITARADDRQEGMLSAGILPSSTLEVYQVITTSDAGVAGVKPGMVLSAVDFKPVTSWGQYVTAVNAAGGKPVTVTFRDAATGNEINVENAAMPALRTSGPDQVELLGLTAATRIADVGTAPTDADGKRLVESEAEMTTRFNEVPAGRLGVRPGDLLARLGDTAWPTMEEVFDVVADAGKNPIRVVVLRDGDEMDLGEIASEGGRLGIAMGRNTQTARIGRVLPDSPFASANIPDGSRIVSVLDESVANWTDLQQQLLAAATREEGEAIAVSFELNLAGHPVEVESLPVTEKLVSTLTHAGWNPAALGVGFQPLQVNLKAATPWDATQLGLKKSKEFIQQTYITLLRLFQGSVGVKNLRGPVGIVDQGAKIAKEGFAYYLFFLALISVNLAVLNFLPLPIVDGGHMVFLIYEKIAGKPASPTVQTVVSLIGLVGLATLFIYITFNDISRLITG